tara:strand:- start:797 stop:1333 length:537 start_codon:yes stop_codon:yes gene_type:complete
MAYVQNKSVAMGSSAHKKLSGHHAPSSAARYSDNSVKVSNSRDGAAPKYASPNKGWFKNIRKKISKVGGNFLRGKGAFGLLNPLGAIGSRMGLFGKRGRGGGRRGGMMGMMGMRGRMGMMGMPGAMGAGRAMMAARQKKMQTLMARNNSTMPPGQAVAENSAQLGGSMMMYKNREQKK